MSNEIYTTKCRLNLRSAPELKRENIITILAQNTELIKSNGEEDSGKWFKVSVKNNPSLEGFVYSEYLEEGVVPVEVAAPQADAKLPPVHLKPSTGVIIKRISKSGRAYPLSESDIPFRTAATDPVSRVNAIRSIINYLNSPVSLRYQATDQATFCNIYAYDFNYLAQVYMPRVWWTSKSIVRLAKGETLPVLYSVTVNEINANSLYNWFSEYGADYGWRRTYSLDELQQSANEGKIGVIIGQRINLNRSGHITICVAETTDVIAERLNGKVTRPVQSQAGVKNYRYFIGAWWTVPNKFRAFGFWIHE